MSLISIYERLDRYEFLWRLLEERDPKVNISHRVMPTIAEHKAFVDSRPYEAWYLICDPDPVGSCYLTHHNEIGVFILEEFQKKGYARRAITELIGKHGKRRYLANISPKNEGSRFLFLGLGFKLIQHTYEMDA